MSDHPRDDLDWLAFRYVSGELTADEERQFESCLADDQSAREAVEEAFELREALGIVAAESLPRPVSRRAVPLGRVVAMLAAAAACLLVAWIWWLRSGGNRAENVAQPAPESDNASAVALAWAEFHDARARGQAPADAPPTVLDHDWNSWEAADEEALVSDGDAKIPAWLLTAAEAISARNEEVQ